MGIVLLPGGGTEQDEDRISDELVDGSLVLLDDRNHGGEIAIEQGNDPLGRQPFAERGEAAKIGHKHRDLAFLSAHLQSRRRLEHRGDDFIGEIAAESLANESIVPLDLLCQPLEVGLAGAGAMVSTLDDMQTWGQALGDGRLIGTELQFERINRSRAVTNGPEYDSYGLGIGILDGWWGHTGTGFGFQAATFYDPHTRSTIAVLVNSTPSGDRLDLNVAEQIFVALAEVVESR